MEWSWIFGRQTSTDQDEGAGAGAGEGVQTGGSGNNNDVNDSPQTNEASTSSTARDPQRTGNRGGDEDEEEVKPVIDFADFPKRNRIFDNPDEPFTLTWEPANKSISVDAVSWRGRKDSGDDGAYDTIAESQRDNGQYPDQKPLTGVYDSGGVLSFMDFFNNKDELKDYRAHNMIIRVDWSITDEGNQTTGFTESGIFTVGSEDEDKEALDDFREDVRNPRLGDGAEVPNSGGGGGGASRGDDDDVQSSATSDLAPATSIPTGDSDDSEDGGGGGDLSTGAIAGIAVGGAVVLLALIGGLIFLCLRRRRRSKDRGQYNNPDNSTTFMAGDKEVHQVTESPHSTYSNDQQVPLSNLAAAGASSHGAGGPSGQHHHRHHQDDDDDADYAPYRDEDASPTSPASGRERNDGAGTPHGVSRSVAHLVEEGMTEAEIRRLEEEERQLDDAIQRHGHR